MKQNYLLIDFENVQPRSLALLSGHPFKVIVFLGANQTKVPVELAKTLQALGKDGDYVQISASGRNALDFHIAYALGELTNQNSDASYHIISKDTGFDPLVRTLNAKGIDVQRSKEIADIPLLRVPSTASSAQKIDRIVRVLKSRNTGRPRKVRTLKNTINSLFSKSLPDTELAELVRVLAERGNITIDGENVSYQFRKN